MDMVLTSTSGKNIGDVGCLSGKRYETDFNVFLKDPDYDITMRSKFSGLTVP